MEEYGMEKEMITNQNSLIEDAKNIVENGRNTAYQSVNAAMVMTYWQLGKRIVEEEQNGQKRADYGKALLKTLSKQLTEAFGKGFSTRALRQFRQFYLTFPQIEKWNTRVPFLTWSHFRCLLRVTNEKAREWYLTETVSQTWSARTLDRNISTQYYERLLLSQNTEPVKAEMEAKTAAYQADKLEFIKNPVVAEFLGLSSNIDFTESELEQSIITHIQKFLMEMGKGYAFVARQQHIRTELDDYFIDLVFYNYILKCFVLIDLKTTKITHQDVGQMDMYIRMYDELKRSDGDNPTLGIVLCAETDEDIARYSVLHGNEQLFATKYKLCLPDESELKAEIERQKEIFRLQHSTQGTKEGEDE
jgi:predicted nuclease of restriction endonuclease-like (RecB) superfamily